MSRLVTCHGCGGMVEMGNQGAASVVEVACWRCDTVMEIDQYRSTVLGVVESTDSPRGGD